MMYDTQIDPGLQRALRAAGVTLSKPRRRMIQLTGVKAGPDYSKPQTNLLLCHRGGQRWEVFVDEDFYYVGADPGKRRVFCGRQRARWTRLDLPRLPSGDVNRAIAAGLAYIESPLMRRLPTGAALSLDAGDESDDGEPLEPHPGEFRGTTPVGTAQTTDLDLSLLEEHLVKPLGAQQVAVRQIVQTVRRTMPPMCPVIVGASGAGKTLLARLAAAELIRAHDARQLVALSGADLLCGAVLTPQRDERLREALATLKKTKGTLALVEQFEQAVGHSLVTASLLCEALDAGVRVIAVRSPHATLGIVSVHALARRLRIIHTPSLSESDLQRALKAQLIRHPLAQRLLVVPEVFPLVRRLSRRLKGANPGAALGLLDAVLQHAAGAGSRLVSPDDVYHVAAAYGCKGP